MRHPADDVRRSRVFVIVSRQDFLDIQNASVVCAPVYSQRRGIATEVHVGPAEGLKHESAIMCDLLQNLSRARLTDYVGALSPAKLVELRVALRIALGVD
jgi:mRNA interferase MazF